MNIKVKALLIAIGILLGIATFVYTMVFHPGYILIVVVIGLVFGLYKLVLNDLTIREKRKSK